MKQIRLVKLCMQNFKGVRNPVEIDFGGKNVNLVGVNGSGKSTVFDAFTWCLFGKDSLGRSDSNKDFEIKPKDKVTGEPIHNLETTVELTLSVDGDIVVLKRVYFENYKAVRGSEEKKFEGHTTDYYVNGVLKLQKDYNSFIKANILEEDKFKLLTDVKHFASLGWKEQREVLESLVSKSEMDVVNENPILEPLKDELILGRTVEDVIKIQKQDQKKINEQLTIGIPAQLKALNETVYKNLDDKYDDALNEKKLEESYNKLSDIDKQLASGSNQAKINELENGKFEIERKIMKLEREIEEIDHEARSSKIKEVQTLKGELAEIEYQAKGLIDKKKLLEERVKNGFEAIENSEEKRNKLYEKYDTVEAEVFTNANCNYCGQALPTDKLEEAKEHFNLHKAERLEEIKADGLKVKEEIDKYTAAVEKFKKDLEELDASIVDLESKISTQKALIEDAEATPIVKSKEIIDKEAEIERNKERIKVFVNQIKKAKEQGTNEILEQAKAEIKAELIYLNNRKAEYQLKLQNDEKIKVLQEKLKELNKKFEQAQRLINLGEKYRAIRAESIDAEVNSNFKLIRFELFRKQINGVIDNMCEATYKGTYYPSCSNGEKINIGLDIINGLQKVYRVSAPIFIDNAEAVSDWLVDANSQLIKMFVDPDVEILEIQYEEEE